jgi:DNA-binding transcriptional ArsR family regulator
VSRPAVSQHLRVLREAGLVAERRQGTRCYYRALPRGLGPLRQYLDRHWESVLDAFEQQARKEARRNE